jgi:hypothetical protein
MADSLYAFFKKRGKQNSKTCRSYGAFFARFQRVLNVAEGERMHLVAAIYVGILSVRLEKKPCPPSGKCKVLVHNMRRCTCRVVFAGKLSPTSHMICFLQ